ncbi:Positive regulator of purine utilization [Paramyrothecium foliicola]|nr:Positive regulator of purine utilization [Paramyrothecium foliicola]
MRKIKCNRAAPKCANCTSSNTSCIIVDPITSEQYPRDYIRELEEKEQQLRTSLDTSPSHAGALNTIESDQDTPNSLAPTISTSRPTAFVGDGSGLSFLRHILSDAKWQVYKPQILHHLAERTQIPERNVSTNVLPPVEEATALMDNLMYHPSPGQVPSPQDHFRLFMVFALSAVTRYRKGDSKEHPFGYYLAAQEYLAGIPLIGTTDAIQNFLLVARFGMYHHIGTSLWEIGRFCMRQCVELGLHMQPRRPVHLLEEQHRRRIFWECYILDCYSSGVLGRPFAISYSDISVELPLDVDDETIINSAPTASFSSIASPSTTHPTELSVFIFCIKLRIITSRVHSEFYARRGKGGASGDATPVSHFSSGHVYVKIYQFLDELNLWRQEAPAFSQPRSLYERPEWYDFLLEKDKLVLIRGAIHCVPRRNGHAPKDLLILCLDSAIKVIELYNQMLQLKYITWTRSYFQVIFAAGLCIIYCVSVGVDKDMDRSDGQCQTAEVLTLCSQILQYFKKEMPDAGRFSIVFEILRDNLLRDNTSSSSNDGGDDGSLAPTATFPDLRVSSLTSSEHQNQVGSMEWQPQTGGVPSEQANAHLQPLPMTAQLPLSPISNINGQPHDFGLPLELQHQQDVLLNWPTLTDEMMQHLEAGLGEFAWGVLDTDYQDWNI